MFDASQYARLTELTELIEKERDRKKFERLIAELNAIMEREAKADRHAGEQVVLSVPGK